MECARILELALERPDLSSRELAWYITDHEGWFVSESTVYRILKKHNLITTPAYQLLEAADEFVNPTTAVNQLWQTDFTYFKIKQWGWYYLSTVMDVLLSLYIILAAMPHHVGYRCRNYLAAGHANSRFSSRTTAESTYR